MLEVHSRKVQRVIGCLEHSQGQRSKRLLNLVSKLGGSVFSGSIDPLASTAKKIKHPRVEMLIRRKLSLGGGGQERGGLSTDRYAKNGHYGKFKE